MPKRTYDNSLRSEQAEGTRQRILDAVVALSSERDADVATSTIAKRAGVSEPTIYRHFPNREALFEAVNTLLQERLGGAPLAGEPGDLPAVALAAALYMGRNGRWLRAVIHNPALRELRMAGRRRRLDQQRAILAPIVAHLMPEDRELAISMFGTVLRAENWDHATRVVGLTDLQAGRGMAFIMEALLERLAKLSRERKQQIVDEAVTARGRELDARAQDRVARKGRV